MRGLVQLGAVIGSVGCLIALLGIAGGIESGSMPFVWGALGAAVVCLTEAGIVGCAFRKEGNRE